jgi:DNA-binding NarL/FixJ family response regulator
MDGGVVMPPRVMGAVWDQLVAPHREEPEDELLARLTDRERQVLLLLAHGGNKDSIARELFISPKTARTHLQNIFAKLGVRSKLQAVALVLKEDWEHALAGKRAS